MKRWWSRVLWATLVVLLGGVYTAHAQRPAAVTYEVTFEEVTNNCPGQAMSLESGTVRIEDKGGNQISVAIGDAPTMTGTRGRGGKFKAEARGGAALAGATGKYSVAGRANADEIQILFIVELYRGKKPLCTQSWSAAGKRKK